MKKDIYPKNPRVLILSRLCISTLVGMLMSVLIMPANAQTVLIDPAGNGGFETGTTFALNGWTLVNAASGNSWCVGTSALAAGLRGAYVSTSAAGSNNNYSNYGGFFSPSASRTVHFYRNVNFPAGETNIQFSFKWKCNGAALFGGADNDDIKVFLAPTGVTPVSGTEVNAIYLIGGPYRLQGSTFQTVTLTLPVALAGTSQRLIFQWRNDNNSQGSNPAGAFDEISLTSCAPPVVTASNTGPQCQGTNLDLSATGGGTYEWTGPNGFTSTSSNPTITSVTTNATGTYSVVVTNNGCSASNSTAVSILAAPVGVAPTASVASACQGTPFTLTSNAGMPNAQINSTSIGIPDASFLGAITPISSPITVANSFTASQVLSVRVNITHPNADNIDMWLRAPNGSQIELSTDNGGSGDNYTNTVFITGAPSITTGAAPFTGNFSPEQPFSSLTGTADGTWQLIVADDAWLNSGTLVNWTITTTSSSGVTYTWSSVPSGFSASGPITTASATVNTTYQVSTSFGSCSTSPIGSFAMNILAPPSITASSNAPVCQGQDLIMNSSGGVGYSWTGPSFSSTQQNPSINGASPGNAGNYTVVVTDAFGCTNSSTFVVGVNANPSVSVISQTDVTCNGGSDGGFTVLGSGGDGNYIYSDGFNISFDGIFSGLPAGPYTIEVIDGNSCMSTFPATVIEPDPTTVAVAGSDVSVCFGVASSLGGNTVVIGTGSWSVVSGNAVFADPSDPLSSVSGLGAGPNVIRWTIDNGVCGSNFDEVTLTGLDQPVASLSGTPVICIGQSALLSVTFTGTSPWTYNYTDGTSTFGPFTSNTATDLISVAPSVNRTYNITSMSDGSCDGVGAGSATVTVNNGLPSNSIASSGIVAPATACTGQVINVACNTVGNVNGYTWSVPAGTLINGEVGPITTATPNAVLTLGSLSTNASSWLICVFASNACGSTNNYCFYVRGKVSVPAPVTGALVACASTTGSYSIPPVSGAQTYTWAGTGGVNVLTGNGTTGVTVSFDPGFTQGTLCVSAGLSCGFNSVQRCFTIKNSTGTLGAMSGPFALCPGQANQVFSVPSVSGASSYQWSVPNNVTIISGQGTPSLTVDVGTNFNVGQLCVTATSNCGVVSAARCKSLSSVSPPTPGNIVGSLNGVCGQTISFNVPSINGVSGYTWSAPAGATIASSNGNNSIDISFINTFTTGQVCVTAQNACGSSVARCSNIKGVPNTPSLISGANSVCAGEPGLSYSIPPVGGTNNYTWTIPAGATIIAGQNTSSIIVDWGSASGTITVQAINDCGPSGTRTLPVTISCRMSSAVSPEFSVYPNPASESVTVSFVSNISEHVLIQLFDLSGRVVFEKSISAQKGTNQLTLELKHLLRGAYLVKVNGAENQSIGRLILQ